MSNNLFGINIGKILNESMGPLLLEGTLIKISRGSRTDGDLTSGPIKTENSYTFKGFMEDYSDGSIDGELIKEGDRKTFILSESLSVVPEIGDKILMESQTRKIVRVTRDPAAASYVCQTR